jgi:stage II sporulation protein AA (anti-sigma F factor antagonist)
MPSTPLRWPLTITREGDRGTSVFVASGRLGTLTSGDLIEALASAIQAGERRFVLDLSGVDYLSSAGLLALDVIQGRLHMVKGDMVLCGITEPVRMALDLSGLLPTFTEAPSRDEALAKLVASSA